MGGLTSKSNVIFYSSDQATNLDSLLSQHFSLLRGSAETLTDLMDQAACAVVEAQQKVDLEAARVLRAKGLNVVLISDKDLGLEEGCIPLAKPVDQELLLSVLNNFIEMSERLKQHDLRILALEREQKLQEDFVTALAHDLRNPLATAKVSAQTIERNPDIDESTLISAKRVVKSVNRVDSMIQDLLDSTLIKAGRKISLAMEFCDLKSLISQIVEEFAVTTRNPIEVDCTEVIKGHWNAKALRRCLENLIANAVKYGAKSQRISLQVKRMEGKVQISVHNLGNPIPPLEQKRIFDPYSRGAQAKASGEVGWGLGLALVKGLVEAHGGQLVLESCPEKGTNFIMHLPLDSRVVAKSIGRVISSPGAELRA